MKKADFDLGDVGKAMFRLDLMDEEAQEAWDERVRRMNDGTATEEDRTLHAAAYESLRAGRAMPKAAQRLPSKPPGAKRFREDELVQVDLALAMGIPPLIAPRIVDGETNVTRSVTECARVTSGELKLLVLIGEKGHGKSYAAADWLWRGPHTYPPVLKKMIKPRKMVSADELDVFDKWEQQALALASALVLDDVGTESEYLSEHVAKLMVRRYRNNLPTIVTTNLNHPAFIKKYGARVEDRIHEIGDIVVVGDDPTKSLRRNR